MVARCPSATLDKDLWIDLTWHSFRVFMPGCAFQAQIPREFRQYLGNWMAESTADVYTRAKRNVVCSIWEQVTSCMDKLYTKGYRAAKIDLVHDDPQDAQQGAAPGHFLSHLRGQTSSLRCPRP